MTTGNIKFTQQPPIASGSITSSTIVPAVESFVNYKMTMGNLAIFINSNSGDISAGNVSATGNITGNYILGNGSQLTGLPATYDNANVVSLMAAFGSNTISTTGNITGGNIFSTTHVSAGGNVSVGLNVNVNNGFISATGNVRGGNINTGGLVTATGNVTGGNINTGGLILATGNVTGGNITTGGSISATGNITGNYFLGNGSQLTGLPAAYGNSNVTTLLANLGSNVISSTAAISTTGNVTGSYLLGVVGTASQTGITSVGTLGSLSVTGNVTGGNVITSGLVSAAGSISGNYYIESVYSGGNTGTGITPAQTNGSVQKFTANANFTLNTPTGMTTGSSITLIFTQDGTGSRLMTPNAAYKFAYGQKTLTTTANAIDVMSVFYDGTNYLCNLVKGYSA